ARSGRRWRWSLGKLHHKFLGPIDLGAGADEAETTHARLHESMILIQNFGIALQLDAEHQLLSLLLGLNAFWRELGIGRDEADGRRNDVLGDRIGNDPRLIAKRELAGVVRRQVDRHVDVVEIEDGQNALPWSHNFTSASESVLHTAASGRNKPEI